MIAGLGGGPIDPVRPGCGSIFGSVFGCGSEFDFFPLPPFVIGTDGTPVEENTDDSEKDCEDKNLCSFSSSKLRTTQEPITSTYMPRSTSSSTPSSVSKTVSSTSVMSPSEYMVFPTAGTTSAELTALTLNFTEELGADNVLPVSLNDAGDQVMYILYMSESFASDLRGRESKVCCKIFCVK